MPITKVVNDGTQCSVYQCAVAELEGILNAENADTYSQCDCAQVSSSSSMPMPSWLVFGAGLARGSGMSSTIEETIEKAEEAERLKKPAEACALWWDVAKRYRSKNQRPKAIEALDQALRLWREYPSELDHVQGVPAVEMIRVESGQIYEIMKKHLESFKSYSKLIGTPYEDFANMKFVLLAEKDGRVKDEAKKDGIVIENISAVEAKLNYYKKAIRDTVPRVESLSTVIYELGLLTFSGTPLDAETAWHVGKKADAFREDVAARKVSLIVSKYYSREGADATLSADNYRKAAEELYKVLGLIENGRDHRAVLGMWTAAKESLENTRQAKENGRRDGRYRVARSAGVEMVARVARSAGVEGKEELERRGKGPERKAGQEEGRKGPGPEVKGRP